jgi:hypothetical protein
MADEPSGDSGSAAADVAGVPGVVPGEAAGGERGAAALADPELAALVQRRGAALSAHPGALPARVLHAVFRHLRPRDLARAGAVCAAWHAAAGDPRLWRALCSVHFGEAVVGGGERCAEIFFFFFT